MRLRTFDGGGMGLSDYIMSIINLKLAEPLRGNIRAVGSSVESWDQSQDWRAQLRL